MEIEENRSLTCSPQDKKQNPPDFLMPILLFWDYKQNERMVKSVQKKYSVWNVL